MREMFEQLISAKTREEALEAEKFFLDKAKEVADADIYTIEPFNTDKFAAFVRQNGSRLVVSEDHYAEAGIGEMLGSKLEGTGIKMRNLGVAIIPHSGRKQKVMNQAGIGFHDIKEMSEEVVQH